MADQEVGRWPCRRCNHIVVAAGERSKNARGSAAFIGPCPWDCGGWINRGFRDIRPGQVKVFRADEWDARSLSSPA